MCEIDWTIFWWVIGIFLLEGIVILFLFEPKTTQTLRESDPDLLDRL